MMSFYKELSSVYDIVFPEDQETTDFLVSKAKGDVLDLACGTGTYTIALGKKGFKSYGVDIDESMIEIAKKKSKENVAFYACDMLIVNNIFKNTKFNLIYCVGNSLVHLKNKESIEELIKQVYNMLQHKGNFVIQIINYDRIIKKSINSLPTLDRKDKGVSFIRNYTYKEDENIMFFETKLKISKDNSEKIYENSVPLIPLLSQELKQMLIKSGFSKVEVYGGFNYEEFNEDSYVTVVSAQK